MADILGVRVTPQLDTLSSIAICNTPGWQANPAVTYNGENYVVAWLETMTDRIYVTRVTVDGAVLGSGHYVCDGLDPDVAADEARSFVVCAKEYQGVVGRFVDAGGQPVDTLLMIAELLATSTRAKVVWGEGKYLVIWPDFCQAGTDLDVFGQLVSPAGVMIGERLTIADGPAGQAYCDVAFDGEQYLVVWNEGHDIVGQFVSTDGVLSGQHFTVSHDDSLWYYHPSVCTGSDKYLVVWSQWDEHQDVYGNLDIATSIASSDHIVQGQPVATIVAGQIPLHLVNGCVLYDRAGRCVEPAQAGPGVYFIVDQDEVVKKIIRIR
jgi:hypothetical protein